MHRSFSLLALLLVLGAPAGMAQDAPPAPPRPAAAAPAERLTAIQPVAEAQARLAFELLERLGRGGAEPTVSPASLAAIFAIIGEGADARMKAAIAKTLGFRDSPEALADLLEARAKLADGTREVFQSADRIVFAPDSPPDAKMKARLDALGVQNSVADLSKPEVAAEIDQWVSEITKGMIPQILGGPLQGASFVALDALHFKGKWKTPFDPQMTAPAPFTNIDGKSAEVKMMRLAEARRAYRVDPRFIGVDLPFSDDRFSLVVVTTKDAPAPVKDFAKVADWLSGAGFVARKGTLALPRFKASGEAELLSTLDALGLDKARRSPTALDGFGKGTRLSQVLQRAVIEVDEEGAEAAAATAVMATRSFAERDESLHMTVDKPYVFALRDRATGFILIAGYVGHAPKGKE